MADPAEPPVSSERVGALEARTQGERSDAIEQLGALVVAATAEMLDVITAADRQADWKIDGATSMTAWLVAMLHVSHATAKEWVRVGASLDALPHLRDAFSAGMLSWDQVRHATVFVTPEEDDAAAQNLPGHTAAQIEEMAKFARARTRRDGAGAKDQQMITWRNDPDNGGFRYRGFLTAENGALVNAALEQRAQRIGKDPVTGVWGAPEARYADALVDMARQDVLNNPGPDPTVVVVHVDANVADDTTAGNGSIQGIPIPADTVRRLLCDCEIDYSIDGNPDTEITFTSPHGRTLSSRPRPLDPTVRHRAQTATGTNLHATGTDPPL